MSVARDSRPEAAAGVARLLDHCEALARVMGGGAPATTARSRLESALGLELAERLVGALARGSRSRAMPLPF